MGDDEHEGGSGAELAEELLEGGGAVVDGEGVGEILRGDAFAGEVGGVLEWRWGGLLGGRDEEGGEEDGQQGSGASVGKESHAMASLR